jgi:hypothetical protein
MTNKTQPSQQSVLEFIESYPNQGVCEDCKLLLKFFTKITGFKPVIWAHMIGYGTYHYKYASGREGDSFLAGFAPSKTGITIYTNSDLTAKSSLLEKLGSHKISKSCLYIKKLSDIDLNILKIIILNGIKKIKLLYH